MSESGRNVEQRLRAAVESSPSGLLMIDASGAIVLVNGEIERLFGYAREELLGKSVDLLVPGRFRESHPGFRRGFLASPSVRSMGVGRDLFGLRKDGTEVPVEIGLTPIATEEGFFVISAVVDITARREAEQASRRLEDQLRQAQKLEAVGTLAGGIAHDFNNILSVIVGYGELIGPELSAEASADLAELLKAAMRGKQLVERILAFSRRQESERKPINLGRVAAEATGLLRSTLSASIEVDQRFAVEGTRIVGDATSIHQVLMNLATNSAYAMPNGGKLAISVEPVYVHDHLSRAHPDLHEGHYAVLAVRDTGSGIDPAVRERVFEPFFTTKPAGSGSGLGLAMVHGIVRDHGGAVLLDSAPGEGTTASCYFPAVTIEESFDTTETVVAQRGNGERILFVDDEQSLARLGHRRLTRLGYQVDIETSSAAALARFSAAPERYDLVVSDYLMPQMSGLDLAREMARRSPGVRIVLLTGFLEDLPRSELFEAGVVKVLKKPVTAAELATAIHEALERHAES